ncbi:nucleotidyltransferase family protein [Paracoccus sp. (in: a-proteobacteria)]|uniref:nucleotidyltransferase family protein n=1 Tax=Paracoccus sp. TaxID=267 RepID=UPI00289B81E2|nr:nucleotidyltransferase family protein [Paracoccus sp. (in: a-proteobacteria)]
MRTFGVLLAAGASRRFGADDKLLANWHGTALVQAAAQTLARSGCEELVAVVSSRKVASLLAPEFDLVFVPPNQPMSASFQAACRFADLRGVDEILITLGDMPAVRVQTLKQLLRMGPQSRACKSNGTPMPPAVIRRLDWQGMLQHDGDQGARAILAALPPNAFVTLGPDEARDIDTLADLRGA